MVRVDYFKNAAHFVEYRAGDVIFNEDQPANTMYAVKEGEVEIFHKGHLLETVEAGHFFGEMSLIDNAPRSATAVAKTYCKIVVVNMHDFLFLVQETPMFAIQVMQAMTSRIRRLDGLIVKLSEGKS